jgi:hypothetical protein
MMFLFDVLSSLRSAISETQVSDPLPASTISVPARNVVQLPFTVNGQQGAVLEGTRSQAGQAEMSGVVLLGPGGSVILNSGRGI